MNDAPKWFKPAAIIALLWNLMGCAAYLSDAAVDTRVYILQGLVLLVAVGLVLLSRKAIDRGWVG